MAKVEIYLSPLCGYCYRAKKLLTEKGVAFIEYDVLSEPKLHAQMRNRADGRNTVPQIFIDDQGIGGCDDLHDLERSGELDKLLAA